MKATIHNPIPWSILRTSDNAYHVTITAGPRESIQLIFPSRVAFGVFADILQAAAATIARNTDGHGGTGIRWESQALKAVRGKKLGPPPDPDNITPITLRAAGFTYDPSSGWDFHKGTWILQQEAESHFPFPGRSRSPVKPRKPKPQP